MVMDIQFQVEMVAKYSLDLIKLVEKLKMLLLRILSH